MTRSMSEKGGLEAKTGGRHQNLIAEPCIPVEGLKHPVSQERQDRIPRIPPYHLFIGQALQHLHLRPAGLFIGSQTCRGKIAAFETGRDEIRQRHRIDHRLHAPLGRVRVHGMGRIAKQGGPIPHPGHRLHPAGRHVRCLSPVGQISEEGFAGRIDSRPCCSQRFKSGGLHVSNDPAGIM